MGVGASNGEAREIPNKSTDATLYYFAGRGLADQIRWMLAVTSVSFTSHVIKDRARFASMASVQLPFGQLPLLQIDNLEIVQSQACVRYLARRGGISGLNPKDEAECDMIAEACKDLISVVANAPFRRTRKGESESVWEEFLESMKAKWVTVSTRFEAILIRNGGTFMVGQAMTYADVLVAHSLTWFVEECGSSIVTSTPMLVALQNRILELPQVRSFIRSTSYYPIGGEDYVKQTNEAMSFLLQYFRIVYQ